MTFKTKLILLLIVAALLHTLYNAQLALHPDEAYYWLWSRYIDWSYYDHPGMIAWLIRLFSFLGDSEWAVRFVTVLCMSGACYALCMISFHAAGEKAGYLCFLVFMALPVAGFGYTIITPDSPLMLFWCLALYWCFLAVTGRRRRYFILTGTAIALMITSKYTAVLFPLSLFFYMLFFDRRLFKNKYTWIACFIGMLGVLPVLIWNMQHEFISIRFQYEHGTSEGFHILWGEFLILLLGIQLLPTPILAFIMYKAGFFYKGFRKETWFKLMMTFFALPLLFFLYKGLFKKMELNWPVICFLSALPVLSAYVASGFHRKLFKAGVALAGVATVILMLSPLVPLPERINIAQQRLFGPKEAVDELKKYTDGKGNYFSNHLTMASMMTFYLEGHPKVYIPVSSRYSQFDIWDESLDFARMSGWYLGSSRKEKDLEAMFEETELIAEFSNEGTIRPRQYYIYKVSGHPDE